MNKSKKILLIIGTLFVLGMICNVLLLSTLNDFFKTPTDILLSAAKLLSLYWIVHSGTTHKSKLFTLLIFLHAIIIIGAMFKVMHWPGAGLLLTISLLPTPIIYLIAFVKKEMKIHLDYLKLIWVFCAYISGWLIIQHWIEWYYLRYIPDIVFWIVIADFAYLEFTNKKYTSTNNS